MKGKYLLILALVMCLGFGASVAFADTPGRGHEGMREEYKPQDLESKFFYKAHKLLKHEEELGLSDKQIERIKDLKLTTKKDLIQKEAEIELLALDIKAQLYEEKVNLRAVKDLIDKKYELKKAKAKTLVEAYVTLKDVLNKVQKEKLKELYKERKRECKEKMK